MDNNLNILIKTISDTPLWIKEVIFNDIKKHLLSVVPNYLDIPEEEIYSLYTPQITFKGKQELDNRDRGHELNIYKCLNSAKDRLRIVDITLNNFWTLEEASRYLATCIKNDYIKMPENKVIESTLFYLSGDLRLGEYIKRINLIDVNQLDSALRRQKEVNTNSHSYQKLGRVMIDMGLVNDNDLIRILQIKEECPKRFIFSIDSVRAVNAQNGNFTELQEKIDKLVQENSLLKEKLRAIFNIQSRAKS